MWQNDIKRTKAQMRKGLKEQVCLGAAEDSISNQKGTEREGKTG